MPNWLSMAKREHSLHFWKLCGEDFVTRVSHRMIWTVLKTDLYKKIFGQQSHIFFLSFPVNQDYPKKKNLTLHFTLQSFFQVCCQMQLSFEEKSVVTGLYLPKLCGHLVRDEIKERKKGKICDCVTSIFFTNDCPST